MKMYEIGISGVSLEIQLSGHVVQNCFILI
jgi:hypothetical protein